MENRLIRKLGQFVRLSEDDKLLLDGLSTINMRRIKARHDLIREGDDPRVVNLILEGWAIRHKAIGDGRRQIIAFLVPGDICDLNVFILKEMDHSIGALTPLTIAQLPRAKFDEIYERHPRITQALHWETLVNGAIQREWTVNLGQRTAIERIAHLLCEIMLRLEAVGLCENSTTEFPVTQNEIAEATGMTAVHVSRTIRDMRRKGLIVWKGRELHVPDMTALQRAAMFNPNYLHLDRDGAHLDANG